MIGYLCGSTIAAILGKKTVTNNRLFVYKGLKALK